MAYAILVARSRSLSAPVETSPKLDLLGHPAAEHRSQLVHHLLARGDLPFFGQAYQAAPNDLPRGMIVTLISGLGILQKSSLP